MGKKICPRCEKSGEFSKNKKKSDGLQVYCKLCMKAANARHYSEYKDKQTEINRKQKTLLRKKVAEVKTLNPCPCGESDECCLDFHHLFSKEDTISRMLSNTYCWERIAEELRKCCVLCSNCHRKVHKKKTVVFDVAKLKPLDMI